ncbi:MAG: ABC transporter permease [Chloroflexi bacterium]|nr:ABC transporter permease [Chloroflexota bacterium]
MTTQEAPQERSNLQLSIRNAFLGQEGVLVVIMVIAVIVLSFTSENFLTVDNLLNQARLMTEVGLIALPMTYIIITGGIDLSVGSIFGFSAVMLGWLWKEQSFPLEAAILASIVIGTLSGLLNALFIVYVRVPPIIMTLATLALYRGMAYGISQARSARGYPDWFFQFGQRDFLGIPTQIWFLIVASIFAWILLARTPFGRGIYAIGNNEIGARFSGIPVNRYLLFIYVFAGFMSAVAAFLFTSRVSTTRADSGTGMELDVIAAVVLGGTSIVGGSGTIHGTLLGLVLLQLLKNGLSLSGVKGDATIVVIGVVLILSILINNYIQKRFRQ